MHTAVKNNAKEAARILLNLGAHAAKLDRHSRSAAHYGAENPEILKVSQVSFVFKGFLCIICCTHSYTNNIVFCYLQLLIGADGFSDALNVVDEDGLSPLCIAIRSAKVECVELLLDAGCSTGPFSSGSLATMLSMAASSPDLPKYSFFSYLHCFFVLFSYDIFLCSVF